MFFNFDETWGTYSISSKNHFPKKFFDLYHLEVEKQLIAQTADFLIKRYIWTFMGIKMIGMVLQVHLCPWWVILMTSCITYDVMNVDIFPRKFLKIDPNKIQWNFFEQVDLNDWISLKYAIFYLFVHLSRLTDMISVQKRTDKIFTYDVILWRWRHRND